MKKPITLLATLGASAFILSNPALAQVNGSYRIEANSDHWVDMCMRFTAVELFADGDNDTDLDYWLYDSNNNQIHSNVELHDSYRVTINSTSANIPAGRDCVPYRLKIHNYGDVWNQMQLTLTTLSNAVAISPPNSGTTSGTTSGSDSASHTQVVPMVRAIGVANTFQIRAEANSDERYTLRFCTAAVRVQAAGDGDTDLDYWIYDKYGTEVHASVQNSDTTVATLRPNGTPTDCVDYQLRIVNLGNVWNMASITLTGQ